MKKNILFTIFLSIILIIFSFKISFTIAQENCPPPPPPPPPPPCLTCTPPPCLSCPPPPPCLSCDPPNQIKFGDGCSGGDCFGGTGAFSFIYIAGKGVIQKRTSEGSLIKKLPVLNDNLISCITSDLSGNLFVSYKNSKHITAYDIEGNLIKNFGKNCENTGQILFDKQSNVYMINKGGIEIVKLDNNGNLVNSFSLPDFAKSMDLSSDQCLMYYVNEKNEVNVINLCANDEKILKPQTISVKEGNAIKILLNGDLLISDGEDILRINSSGKIIQTYDLAAHDNWYALAIDPDGSSFWGADNCNSNIWRFDIQSGKATTFFNAGISPGEMSSIFVKSESSAEQKDISTNSILNLKVALQTISNETETITVSLRKNNAPYQIADICSGILDKEGNCSPLVFSNIVSGSSYIIVVNHKNSIETWSAGGIIFDKKEIFYDFTTDIEKAYGRNLISENYISKIVGGDLNQDGIVDIEDLSIFQNFLRTNIQTDSKKISGKQDIIENYDYPVNIDLNGDHITNAKDLDLLDLLSNNSIENNIPDGAEMTSKLINFNNITNNEKIKKNKKTCNDIIKRK